MIKIETQGNDDEDSNDDRNDFVFSSMSLKLRVDEDYRKKHGAQKWKTDIYIYIYIYRGFRARMVYLNTFLPRQLRQWYLPVPK